MRILVDVLHPAHVHFFRHQIERWTARGDEVVITTRDKDLTHALLDEYGLEYTCLSRQQRGWRKAAELVVRWWRMYRIMRRVRPNVAMSITGISTALPARLLRIPNLAFTDTETARISNRLSIPFATRVLTPDWYRGDLGPKHHRYRGLHEWAYLSPDVFTPDPEVVRRQGLDPAHPYAVVRLVGWDAVHDRGERGLSAEVARRLVEHLATRLPVHLSVEGPAPDGLTEHVAVIDPTTIHDVLAHAVLYVGDGASMALEAALLGTPAVYVASVAEALGNVVTLRDRGILRVSGPDDDVISLVDTAASGSSTILHQEVLAGLDPIGEVVDHHISAILTDSD